MMFRCVLLLGVAVWARMVVGADKNSSDVQAGIQALEQHNFQLAEQIFASLAAQYPSAENLTYLGMAEASDGRLDEAIQHFRESIQKGNDTANVHYNLGLAYVRSGKVEFGISELKSALSIDPNYTLAMYSLGVVFIDAGHLNEGLAYLARVVKARPRAADAWANLVRAYFEAGDVKDAEDTIGKATKTLPDNVRLAATLADICVRFHQIQKARYLLENATEAGDDPTLKLMLAKVSLLAGEPIEALAVLKDVGGDSGRPGEIAMLKGQADALTTHLDDAQAEFSAAIKADPKNARYLTALAWLKQLRGLHTEALCILRTAHDLDPDSPYIAYRLALSYFLMGKVAQAADICRSVTAKNSSFDQTYFLLGMIRLEEHRYMAAQEAFARAVNLRPNSSLYHRQLGVAEFMAKHFPEGKQEFDKALGLNPNDADSYYWRGRELAEEGDRQEAIKDLEAAVAIDSRLRQAYTELAALYSADGQTAKASELAAKARELETVNASKDLNELVRGLPDISP